MVYNKSLHVTETAMLDLKQELNSRLLDTLR